MMRGERRGCILVGLCVLTLGAQHVTAFVSVPSRACPAHRFSPPPLQRSTPLHAEATGKTTQEALTTIQEGVSTRKVPVGPMVEALDVLQQHAEASALSVDAQSVEGDWELIFSTQLKKGYMPVCEIIGFYPSKEEMSINTTAFGGFLSLGGIEGECQWNDGQNKLDFSLDKVKIGPFSFNKKAKGKAEQKSYTFFHTEPGLLCAKSSAGSVSVLAKEDRAD